MNPDPQEEVQLRLTAQQNAHTIFTARQRATDELERAKETLELQSQALGHSLSMIRATLDAAMDGILVTNEGGEVTDYNAHFARMWGLSPMVTEAPWRENIAQYMAEFFEDPGIFRSRIEEIYATMPAETYDVLNLSDHRIVERFSRIQFVGQQRVGRVWIFRDITERRRAEEARYRLAAIVESSDDAIVSKTTDGIITSWNLGAERMFGYSESEIVGRPITLLIPPDRSYEEEVILKKLRKGERVENYETLRVRKDGGLLDVSLTVSPIRNAQGDVVGASKIARDVTARKRTEAALREEYNIIEQLNDVARSLATELELDRIARIITEAGRRITHARFAAFFQWALDENGDSCALHTVSGESREAFNDWPPSRLRTALKDASGRDRVLHVKDLAKEGLLEPAVAERSVSTSPLISISSLLAVPIKSRSGVALGILILGDAEVDAFTERDEKIVAGMASQAAAAMETARLYHTEKQARFAAEQASRAKDFFLAALSHELRTPLTPALAILSSVCQGSVLPPQVNEDLETVRRNVELEARLIDDLLDLSRIVHGKLELHPDHVRVGQIVEDVLITCRPDITAKEISITCQLHDPVQMIFADGPRITQVLWNLVKNATKFTPPGGSIVIRSRGSSTEENSELALEVVDSGIGIESDRISKVFEAFEQGDRAITRQFGGLGLGLAISRAIAESHNGTLTASSEGLGRGSTFTFTLPASRLVKALRTAPSVATRDDSSPASEPPVRDAGRTMSLLLVEDHADSARALGALLRRRGYQVTLASSMTGALEAAATARFDAVISDLGLPDGNGYDLMKRIRELYDIPGIALSGYAMEEDIQKCYEAGFLAHLVKPVPMSMIIATLDRLFSKA